MNWKEEYINKFCTFEGENRMVFKNKITADESLNFIEQIISERDKEWIDKIENYRDGWVRMYNNEPEFAPEYQVIQDLITKLQTLNK